MSKRVRIVDRREDSYLYAIIIAGGRGERFWPKSRASKPKQFLPILGTQTMLQLTVKRIKPIIPLKRIYVVTAKHLACEVRKQLPGLPQKNVILEPFARNTAPAIGLAMIRLMRIDANATTLILPADHLIIDERRFLGCVKAAARHAKAYETLVVFGIQPETPHTGYGYIKAGKIISEYRDLDFSSSLAGKGIGERGVSGRGSVQIYEARAFTEKPDVKRAEHYLKRGCYYWNSGMFVWRCRVIMDKIRFHMPRLFKNLENIKNLGEKNFERKLPQVYRKLKSISIDYGVMEKASGISMVRGDFGWDDVGSWLAMERINRKDSSGNIAIGKFLGIDTKDSIIVGNDILIGTVGISDTIVVGTEDAILVCSKKRAQDVKKLVEEIKKQKLQRYLR